MFLLPFTKHLYSPPGLNLKLLSVLCVPVWGGGAGGEVAGEKGRQEKEGGADSGASGSLFTLEPPTPSQMLLQGPWGGAAGAQGFSYPVGKGVLSETLHS